VTKTYLKYKNRITILAGFILFSWAGLCARLFQVQVLNGTEYKIKVVEQSQKKQIIPANRGNIFDRNNKPLTRNIIHYTLSVNPKKVTDKIAVATAVSERTGEPKKKYIDKIDENSNFEYLERNLQRETLGLLTNHSFTGLNIKRKYKRYYPHSSIGAQLIGYTNIDDEGISGIEKDFNKYLKGSSGWVHKTKGLSGKIQHKSGMPFNEPINGNNIQLTIDLEYQSILEQELLKRQVETNAKSATGIIINPQSGEILAMASVPGFDNNNFSESEPELHKVRAITDQFEPGSTFKVVSAVAALKQNDISLFEEFDCENGKYQYYNISVSDHEKYEMLTLPQIIKHSSNIGIVKMVERIGSKKLFETCRDLGFGSKTGINLKGEVTGKLSPYSDWSTVSLGQIAMGHEVGVTALQIATAYCAIANGGFLVKPRLIRQIIDQNNNQVFSEKTKVLRRIADVQTMKEIRQMLRGVITDGTGENASIAGWKIAGKTGTAQKWKDGKYSNKQFISNFVGFFPYDDPKILTFIMLDEPSQPFHWGSEGAAVAFNRVVKRIINMDNSITPPKNKKYTSLKKPINYLNKEIDIKDKIEPERIELSFLSTQQIYGDKTEVPEIRGFSMRKAMRVLRSFDLNFKIQGTGKVLWQSPRPGAIVKKETICVVGLE
jgi:cell division protein FtsI (penicillin-binding protein 3)